MDVFDFVNAKSNDSGYLRHENDYMNTHPIGNPKVGEFHPSAVDQHLANNHGGIRNANMVRTDIRTGLHMLQGKPHGGLLSAERMGYEARKHLYFAAQESARKK